MNESRYHTTLVAVGILVVVSFLGVILFRLNYPSTVVLKSPPVTILYLDGAILHFKCLNTPNCLTSIDLGNQIKSANNPDQHPLYFVSAYYNEDSTLYLFFTGSVWNYLAKVNLGTKKVQILDLNLPSLTTATGDNLPTFYPGIGRLIHGKIVVATMDGKIGIVQDDFSIMTIDLKSPIFDFIEADNSKIAVISADNRLQSNRMHIKVFLVDIISGKTEEKTVDGPQEGGWIVTVDHDIKHLYWVGSNNSLPDNMLHMYDTQIQKDVIFTSIPSADALAYTTLTSARYQYHDMWYYSRRCCLEGPAPALLLNMLTLKSLINPDELLKDENVPTFMIAPFGDDFLIGMDNHVLMVSPNGEIIQTYHLPQEWVGRDYVLVEYRK